MAVPTRSARAPMYRFPGWLRGRMRYVALASGTIAVGLAVHLRGSALPPDLRDILGDALWAAMVVWGIAAVWPAIRLLWRAGVAFVVCSVVEFSQLLHSPALDALRGTAGGYLVLGSGFDRRDFAAYAAGVFAAVLLERVAERQRSDRPSATVPVPGGDSGCRLPSGVKTNQGEPK